MLITLQLGVLATVLFTAFGFLDFWAFPSGVATAWRIRGFVVLVNLAVIALTVSRHRSLLLRHYQSFTALQHLFWAASIEWLILQAKPGDPARYSYYAGLMLVSLALFSCTYLSRGLALALSAAIMTMYVALALGVQGLATRAQWPVLLSNSFFLIAANVLGAYAQGTRDRFARDNFLRKQTLRHDLDMTELARRHSDYEADHDPLTGLYNRQGLLRQLGTMLVKAKAQNEVVSLFFIDLDGFKQVNDTLGHATGDIVLKVVSHRLKSGFKESDIFARLGGDEFVVALNFGGRSPFEARVIAEAIARKITERLCNPMRIDDKTLQVNASIGSALFPFQSSGPAALLAFADARMYEAKRDHGSSRIA